MTTGRTGNSVRMKLVLITTACIALAACVGDETLSGYGASGTEWVLNDLDGAPLAGEFVLQFPEEGKMTGRTKCSFFEASQTAPYPWFEIGQIEITKRNCLPTRDENRFLEVLQKMTLAETGPGILILSTPDGMEMVFKADD